MEEHVGSPTLLLPDDVLRGIFHRVSTDDVAALFRCGTTCKRWRRLIADRSFLRRCFPGNSSSWLLGFFQKVWVVENNKWDEGHEANLPFFSPVLPGSVFGSRRRSVASFLPRVPDAANVLNNAVPVAARRGLVLMRQPIKGKLIVCDTLTGTLDTFRPPDCEGSCNGYIVLNHEDCRPSDVSTSPSIFKVLTISIEGFYGYTLHTFMSSQKKWISARNCFDAAWKQRNPDHQIILGTDKAVVCRGVAHWLGFYSENKLSPSFIDKGIKQDANQGNCVTHYFTFGVNIATGRISAEDIPIPAEELPKPNSSGPILDVDANGRLSLLLLDCVWTRADDGTWLRIAMAKPIPPQPHFHERMWLGKKINTFFIALPLGKGVYEINIETGVAKDVKEEMFHDDIGQMAVPMEIDWPTIFSSRLSS